MKIDKKAINYYYSFFEVSKELNQKQFYEFNMAIYKVMFFEIHIDEVEFEDKMLTILWKSVKHSIQASVKGYCDKKSIPYDEVFTPLSNPLTNKQEGQGEEKGQVQEQCVISKGKDEFTFSLKRDTHFSNLSKEYIDKLNEYIINIPQPHLSFEDFRDGCLSKNSYKYKNFTLTYNKWNKNHTPQKAIVNVDLALENNIYDLIDQQEAEEKLRIENAN